MHPYTDDFYKSGQAGSRRSAQIILPMVLELVHPRRVVDVGCGVGTWLGVLREMGVEDVWGMDGDYVNRDLLHFPRERFLARDLTQPARCEQRFDLAISVEVAEHLPAECAPGFVESLARLAPVVLFSAAIPFSRGSQHLNEQWPEYWAKLFQERDFVAIDCLRRRLWQEEAVEWWYAQNIMLFARPARLESDPALRLAWQRSEAVPPPLVHPRNYLIASQLLQHFADHRNLSLRTVAGVLPFATLRFLKRMAGRVLGCRPQ